MGGRCRVPGTLLLRGGNRSTRLRPPWGVGAVHIGGLLVDDEPDVRLLLRKMIEAENDGLFVLGEAADGQEALDALDRLNPSVIVIDERMPAMSGMEAAAIIMSRRPGQPIVLCTA